MWIDAFGHSQRGSQRDLNEDDYLCLELARQPQPLFLLCVADGMGGHAGGDVASSQAVRSVRASLEGELPEADDGEILRAALVRANRVVRDAARGDGRSVTIGTTMVVALVRDARATIANVGDSRAYLVRPEGAAEQLTRDHSWAAERRRQGGFTEEEIESSPLRSMITRCLGAEDTLEVDLFEADLSDATVLLLCSDGVHGALSAREIAGLAGQDRQPESVCRALIEAAVQSGSEDDVTVVAARLWPNEAVRKQSAETAKLEPVSRDEEGELAD